METEQETSMSKNISQPSLLYTDNLQAENISIGTFTNNTVILVNYSENGEATSNLQ